MEAGLVIALSVAGIALVGVGVINGILQRLLQRSIENNATLIAQVEKLIAMVERLDKS